MQVTLCCRLIVHLWPWSTKIYKLVKNTEIQ